MLHFFKKDIIEKTVRCMVLFVCLFLFIFLVFSNNLEIKYFTANISDSLLETTTPTTDTPDKSKDKEKDKSKEDKSKDELDESADSLFDLLIDIISPSTDAPAEDSLIDTTSPTTDTVTPLPDTEAFLLVAPTVATQSVNSITSNSAILNSSIISTGGENVISRGFQYGSTIAYGSAATTDGSFEAGTFSQNINGLSCGTIYHFRAFATNSVGTNYGDDATFTTIGCQGGGGGAALSSTKAITAFIIPGQAGATAIDENTHTIVLTMPYGGNVIALAPIITITGSSVNPASGAVKNFASPQTYIVTAANGSTQNYIVIVNIDPVVPKTSQTTDWFIKEAKRADIVRDGKIDILDFNTLMVNWGKKGIDNPADVNQDQFVDIFDFNLLMVNWGKTEIK